MYQANQITSSVVYIGQIPYEWDEANLRSVICGSGKVVEVRLGFDFIGKNKGFCFIEYQNPSEAAKAIPILSQIKIIQPGSNQLKRLRVESSKEAFKSNMNGGSDTKQVLILDRLLMPPNVQIGDNFNNDGRIGGSPMPLPQIPQIPQIPQVPSYGQVPATSTFAPKIPQLPTVPGAPNSQMPSKFSTASKNLPVVAQLPFSTPDKINETLSKIPPAQLIELVSTLKNILNGPEASRAYEVFQLSPDLATTVAQALLLMGFIDGDVISESMKAAQATPTPPPQLQPQYSAPVPQYNTPPVPQYNTPPVPQFNSPTAPQYNTPPPQFNTPPVPQAPVYQSYNGFGGPSKWPHLPPNTQQKLLGLPPDQAELIAQVLSLPADQISTLPPDKQSMVTNLRAQYL